MTDTRVRSAQQASTGELVSHLSEEVSALVRGELALAKAELTEKGKRAGVGAGLFGTAGVLAMYGVGALLVTVGAALALVWPAWLAALVVTAVVFAVAAVVALIGKRQVNRATPPTPTEAMDSSKRDVDAVKAAAHTGRNA
ncbi:phage holin family protein [Mangrovihabitans endophyticus]|uniref:Membrane protein n=1 Tax=Mangrovihabitans endophyticus TaxID=1751298 RepID=A0A8J3C2H1_9ACTN|nr:phage holin family protein [Mangrovihabitans endophyticus]GGL08174.1 membrane protein [Mangrovihabitans endophyticus]